MQYKAGIYKAGIYKVFWEDTNGSKKLKDFDCFHQESDEKYILIQEILHKQRAIAIVDYDSEYEINQLISDGYVIREFVKDKCIMELKPKKQYSQKGSKWNY